MPDTTDWGWRVQQLRLRRGWQQNELARAANIDAGFLNRLERGSSRTSEPKPVTINKLLNALNATQAEREAVFHHEATPLTAEEISSVVAEFAASADNSPEPQVLIDEHWYRRYTNRLVRAMFELSDEEYERMNGTHIMAPFVDPSSPMYAAYRDTDRTFLLEQRISAFKTLFAPQQFDRWYLEVEAYITSFQEGAYAWNRPDAARSHFVHHHEVTSFTRSGKRYALSSQINILLLYPRFSVAIMEPRDEETAYNVEQVRQQLALGLNP